MNRGDVMALCSDMVTSVRRTWWQLPASGLLSHAEPIRLSAELTVFEGANANSRKLFPTMPADEAVATALKKAARPVAIVFGDAGSGKSVVLKWQACQAAQAAIDHSSLDNAPIPIYCDLERWRGRFISCRAALRHARRSRGLNYETPVDWYLDGLDALDDVDGVSIDDVLETAYRPPSKLDRFVLSAQPLGPIVSTLDDTTETWRISLAPLTVSMRHEWVNQHCPQATDFLETFKQDDGHASAFLDTPLLFALVVAAALNKEQLRCEEYPGLAGIIRGFVNAVLMRAVKRRRIKASERRFLFEDGFKTVAGVSWAAWAAGASRCIAFKDIATLMTTAFGDDERNLRLRDWRRAADIMQRAGLLNDLPEDTAWSVLHEHFLLNWAAIHLQQRFCDAIRGGWFDAELWDHFGDARFDSLTAQALAMLTTDGDIRWLRRAFESMCRYSKHEAIKLLGSVGGDAAAELIIPCLDDSKLAAAAVDALGRGQSENAIEPLWARLQSGRNDGASRALAAMTSPQIALLAPRVRSDDVGLRHCIAGAFSQRPSVANSSILVELLDDPDDEIGLSAVQALRRLNDRDVAQRLEQVASESSGRWAQRAALALGKIASINAIRPLLVVLQRRREPDELVSLLKSLDKHPALEAVLKLTRLDIDLTKYKPYGFSLDNADHEIRAGAAVAMGLLGSPQHVEYLIGCFHVEPHVEARFRLLQAIGRIGGSRATEFLLDTAGHCSAEETHEAALALARMGHARGFELLMEDQWLNAIDLRGIVPSPQFIQTLCAHLQSPEEKIRYTALGSLEYVLAGNLTAVLPQLVNNPYPDIRLASVFVARYLNQVAQANAMAQMLNDPDEVVSRAAAPIFMWLKAEMTPEAVPPYLSDARSHVRQCAARALAETANKNAGHFDLLASLLNDRDSEIRNQAIFGLCRLGKTEMLPTLIDLMPSLHEAVKALTVAPILDLWVQRESLSADDVSACARSKGLTYEQTCQLFRSVRPEPWDIAEELRRQRQSRSAATLSNSTTVVYGQIKVTPAAFQDSNLLTAPIAAPSQGETVGSLDEVPPIPKGFRRVNLHAAFWQARNQFLAEPSAEQQFSIGEFHRRVSKKVTYDRSYLTDWLSLMAKEGYFGHNGKSKKARKYWLILRTNSEKMK